MKDAQNGQDLPLSHKEDATISFVYTGISADALPSAPRHSGGPTSGATVVGVSEWISQNRKTESVKDLCFSDEPEEDFVNAMDAGAPITKAQVSVARYVPPALLPLVGILVNDERLAANPCHMTNALDWHLSPPLHSGTRPFTASVPERTPVD